MLLKKKVLYFQSKPKIIPTKLGTQEQSKEVYFWFCRFLILNFNTVGRTVFS